MRIGIFGREARERRRLARGEGERASSSPGSSTWARSPRARSTQSSTRAPRRPSPGTSSGPSRRGRTSWSRPRAGTAPSSTPRGSGRPAIGVLTSPNFSLSVAFMRRAALAMGRFAALDADSPSRSWSATTRPRPTRPAGTAKLLAEALAQGCPRYSGWNQGRAEEGKINIASLSAGTEVGYHEIRLETGADALVLSHEADSREIFAKGALVALRWIQGRQGPLHLRRPGRGRHRPPVRE